MRKRGRIEGGTKSAAICKISIFGNAIQKEFSFYKLFKKKTFIKIPFISNLFVPTWQLEKVQFMYFRNKIFCTLLVTLKCHGYCHLSSMEMWSTHILRSISTPAMLQLNRRDTFELSRRYSTINLGVIVNVQLIGLDNAVCSAYHGTFHSLHTSVQKKPPAC